MKASIFILVGIPIIALIWFAVGAFIREYFRK
jgi:hypothetical protein